LLGLFFVSIGAGLDIGALFAEPAPVAMNALGLILVKAAIIFALASVFGVERPAAIEAALLLAPGGEFAFALLTSAMNAGVLPGHFGADAMVVVTLTIFFIPLMGRIGARLTPRNAEAAAFAHLAPETQIASGRVMIVGFGRIGGLVGDMLSRHDIPYVAVDDNVAIVAEEREKGVEIYWGNASRRDFLLRCGVEQARALVVTVHKASATEEIVRLAHEIREDLVIVARARDADHATTLYRLGASDAIPETIEASLQLAETVLVDIGVPMGYVIASIHEKRDEYRRCKSSAPGRDAGYPARKRPPGSTREKMKKKMPDTPLASGQN